MNLAQKSFSAFKGFSSDLIDIVDRSLSPRHGLINSLVEEPPTADGLRLVYATVSPPTYFRDNAPTRLHTTDRGTGAGFSRERACWAAIGEALERYAGSIYWPDKLTFASAAELGPRAISLKRLIQSGKPQVRLFNAAAHRAWVEGEEILSGRPVLVPAAMTYLGYVQSGDDEIISQNDSTGLACGQTLHSATLGALSELIERDLFASTWLLQRRPPRLALGDAIERLDVSVQLALRGSRPQLELYYLGCAYGVHVVVCQALAASGHGIVAAAASPFILTAIEKAVCEGLYTWRLASRQIGKRALPNVADIASPSDHLHHYLDPKRYEAVRAIFDTSDYVALTDLLLAEPGHMTAADIAADMARDGIIATRIDLTTRDIAQLGLSVARVVAPGLQPLIFGPACVLAPDQRRLNHWREAWSLRGQSLNPLPHPFP